MSPADEAHDLLAQLGVESGGSLVSHSPIDGQPIGSVAAASASEKPSVASSRLPRHLSVSSKGA